MSNMNRRQLLGAAAAATLAPFGLPAAAQAWPSRAVKLVCPYAPGGSSDILTRVLGQYLTQHMGQAFLVENHAGAGTRIANDYVAKAAPDGYTILHAAAPIAIGEALYAHLPYDMHKSFAPIVSTAIAPLFLVVNASAPYRTVAEFVQWGKANPKGFTFGSPGQGSAPHLTAEMFIRASGAKGLVVQFKGDAPAYTELLAGRIDATLTAISTAVPYIQAGKLRVLAVATEKRTPLRPEVPTFVESGLKDVVGYGWYGMVAPVGTPDAVIQRLNAETNAAIADPEIKKKAETVGLELRGGTPEAFRAFLDAEAKKWGRVIRESGITAE